MAIDVIHTPQGGQVGRGAGGRFTSLKSKEVGAYTGGGVGALTMD